MGVWRKAFAHLVGHHSIHVVVQQTGTMQLADDVAQTACGVELIHIRRAVWIHTSEQRHDFTERVHVFPAQLDPRHARNRNKVQRVVGRAAGCEQADYTVDDGFFVE